MATKEAGFVFNPNNAVLKFDSPEEILKAEAETPPSPDKQKKKKATENTLAEVTTLGVASGLAPALAEIFIGAAAALCLYKTAKALRNYVKNKKIKGPKNTR